MVIIRKMNHGPKFFSAAGAFFAGRAVRSENPYLHSEPGDAWAVASVNGVARGISGLTAEDGAEALIHSGYVEPEFRRRGLYRQMLEANLSVARARKVALVRCTASPMSASTFRALGFRETGVRGKYTRMELEL